MSNDFKLTQDGFLWLLVSREQAELLFKHNKMEVYCLFPDDSESLIEELSDLSRSDIYGIEVEYIVNIKSKL